VLSVSLAFAFGYSITMLPLLRGGLTLRRSLPLALASDTLSIATMELLDTLIIVVVPGAMNAGLGEPLFWGSLAGALFVAFWAAFPVNRALIVRAKGHAVIHAYHQTVRHGQTTGKTPLLVGASAAILSGTGTLTS
jgi:Domain of unknown function (DUF4396)